jgi:hypothetical protein
MSQESILNYINEKIDTLSSTITDFNPSFLFNSQSQPDTQKITFQILESHRKKCLEKNLVALVNNNSNSDSDSDSDNGSDNGNTSIDNMIPKDKFSQLYFSSIGILSIYILYNIMKKTKMIPI